MQISSFRFFLLLTILTTVLWLAGCATPSPPARFYRLTSEAPRVPVIDQQLVIGVGPVILAGYLDRPQRVTSIASNQLRVDEFERWGGGLERNVASVMAENLSRLLGTDGVVTQPWGSTVPIGFQVAIELRRLDLGLNGQVHLLVQWRLFRGDGEKLLTIHRSALSEPVTGDGYNARAAAESRALASLSQEIADAIKVRMN